MECLSDGGSIPPNSTKWPKDEHLLFQRRFCRNGVVLRVKEKRADKVCALPAFSYRKFTGSTECYFVTISSYINALCLNDWVPPSRRLMIFFIIVGSVG